MGRYCRRRIIDLHKSIYGQGLNWGKVLNWILQTNKEREAVEGWNQCLQIHYQEWQLRDTVLGRPVLSAYFKGV